MMVAGVGEVFGGGGWWQNRSMTLYSNHRGEEEAGAYPL